MTMQQLIDQWITWCEEQGLRCLSADEMEVAYGGTLTEDQVSYIRNYIRVWDETMEGEQ